MAVENQAITEQHAHARDNAAKKKKRTKRRRNVVTKIQQPNVQYEAETKMTKECEKIGERTGQTNGSQQAARNGEERWRPPP